MTEQEKKEIEDSLDSSFVDNPFGLPGQDDDSESVSDPLDGLSGGEVEIGDAMAESVVSRGRDAVIIPPEIIRAASKLFSRIISGNDQEAGLVSFSTGMETMFAQNIRTGVAAQITMMEPGTASPGIQPFSIPLKSLVTASKFGPVMVSTDQAKGEALITAGGSKIKIREKMYTSGRISISRLVSHSFTANIDTLRQVASCSSGLSTSNIGIAIDDGMVRAYATDRVSIGITEFPAPVTGHDEYTIPTDILGFPATGEVQIGIGKAVVEISKKNMLVVSPVYSDTRLHAAMSSLSINVDEVLTLSESASLSKAFDAAVVEKLGFCDIHIEPPGYLSINTKKSDGSADVSINISEAGEATGIADFYLDLKRAKKAMSYSGGGSIIGKATIGKHSGLWLGTDNVQIIIAEARRT